MALGNPFKLLQKLERKPLMVNADVIKGHLSEEDKKLLQNIGISAGQLFERMHADVAVNYDRARFYNEITRACLTGDTRVWLLDGTTPTIGKMISNPSAFIGKSTFSINPETLDLEPDRILDVKKTRLNAQLVRVTLDNGEWVDCTPDHRFMMRDGSYKEAQSLQSGDSLMPLYLMNSDGAMKSYKLVYRPATGKHSYIHQHVARCLFEYEQNNGLVVHHRDFNKLNNDPSNLQVMTSIKHKELHGKYAHRVHNRKTCQCCVCKAIRGETTGKNAYGYKKTPWNKGATKETNKTVAKYAKNQTDIKAFITKLCACGCNEQFKNEISKKIHNFLPHHNLRVISIEQNREAALLMAARNVGRIPWNKGLTKENSESIRKIAEKNRGHKNHKVISVDWLKETQDVYDLVVEKNHNFPLASGVFVHNCDHWMIGPAIELYADYATNYSSLHNASVWVTSDNPTYQRILTKLLDDIGIEEKIFDWAWNTGAFGDLFVRIYGTPGIGIVSIDDDQHPINMSRIDHNGCLVGFFETPQGMTEGGTSSLIPPWEIVHFRTLGAKRKRPQFGDTTYSEFRASYLMTGADNKQVTSRYGTSVIINSLAAYKRLRLAEDSLLMARLTRGVIRYIWKLKVDSNNQESVNELMGQLVGMLKKARALDTSTGSPNFDSKFGPLSAVEDLLIPVWGDTGDLTYDKIGGEVDIRWIVDIEELRNQLACTLRVPLSVLGGYVEEASGSLGSQAIEKLSIEFAHTARRLQRAIKTGIKRMCQVHLAYMNMDPDPRLFEVCMTETSTAEEETIKDTLDTGCDVISKMMDIAEAADPNVDKIKIFNYLNQKILKLDDFDLNDFMKPKEAMEPEAMEPEVGAGVEGGEPGAGPSIDQLKSDLENAEELAPEAGPPEKVPESRIILSEVKKDRGEYIRIGDSDLVSYLPITEKCLNVGRVLDSRWQEDWEETYKDMKVKVEKV